MAYFCHLIIYSVLWSIFGIRLGGITGLYSLIMAITMLPLGIRRMHDAGTRGWVILIPFVSLFFLLKGSKEAS